MKTALCAVMAILSAAACAAPSTAGETRPAASACYLQASVFSAGFTWGVDGPGMLSLLALLDVLSNPRDAERDLYDHAFCPVDVGIVGFARARRTYGISANVFANGAANGDRTGYRWEGVLPERRNCHAFAGLQLAGLGNQYEEVRGLQVAGGSNSAVYGRGMQVAGIVDQAFDFDGVQISGLFNFCETLDGLQVGLFNVANGGRCVQIGVVNLFSGPMKGLQVGLLNGNLAFGFLPVLSLAY